MPSGKDLVCWRKEGDACYREGASSLRVGRVRLPLGSGDCLSLESHALYSREYVNSYVLYKGMYLYPTTATLTRTLP